MPRTPDVIGYAYEAALHCDACTMKRFPTIRTEELTDSEGNPVGEITRWDVDPSDTCDDCRITLHPDAAVYVIGSNLPGYMPDNEPFAVVGTFDDAKRALIGELEHAECYAINEEEAEEISEAMQDVDLWSGPDSIRVGMYVHWIAQQ